ncbi:MAG: toll/interleukin-1 receptor domain-containing protein [Bacteroidaceae bacterium]|nr:toll/interleukin-1 receptor domain-containing protein [Bacteroidaceae bacterium]
MAKKIIRPSDIRNRDNRNDELIPNIVNGNCILIVGSEIILSKEEFPEYDGDSHNMLFSNVREWLIEDNIISEGHKAQTFTQLSKDFNKIDEKIKELLENTGQFSVNEICPSLVQLVKSKYFRTVLTTTIDPYIYNLMREVWGDELRVMNIYCDKWEDGYDFKNEIDNDSIIQTPPTLYYIFGKGFPNKPGTRFAITDNDYIEVLSKWMSASAPTKLLNHVRSKRIVALGCKFDDWFFRFFWYLMRGTIKGLTDGEVAISLNPDSEIDNQLQEYLKGEKIHFEPDARKFIKETLEQLQAYQRSEEEEIKAQRRHGEIFLSYAHEDYDIVKKIFYRLTKEGYRVWFDNEKLKGGNNYDREIREAISQCRIFIPVLSSQVQSDLCSGATRYYKDTEWSYAQTHYNTDETKISILPLKILGYDERSSDNYGKLPQCIQKSTVFNLETSPMSTLIDTINNILDK